VSLFDSIEDLICENDRRCDNDDDHYTLELVFHLGFVNITYGFVNKGRIVCKLDT
jgi:hypothetical protein